MSNHAARLRELRAELKDESCRTQTTSPRSAVIEAYIEALNEAILWMQAEAEMAMGLPPIEVLEEAERQRLERSDSEGR